MKYRNSRFSHFSSTYRNHLLFFVICLGEGGPIVYDMWAHTSI